MYATTKLPAVLKRAGGGTAAVFDGLDVSEQTRKEYRQRIDLFALFVGRNGFNRNTLVEFKRSLARNEQWAVATRNKYLTTAKVFVRELYRLGVVPVDVSINVKGFRQDKLHKREGLNEKEVQLLARSVRKLPSTLPNERLRAMFALLIFQGLRQIELVRLDVEDVRLDTGVAYIHGKGRDDKEAVWLAPQTIQTLRRYLRATGYTSGSLFRSLGNRKAARLSTMTIKRDMRRVMHPLGIKKTVHGCRHYYTTTILRRLNPMEAKKFTRHKSLDMLVVYNDALDTKRQSKAVFRCFSGVRIG